MVEIRQVGVDAGGRAAVGVAQIHVVGRDEVPRLEQALKVVFQKVREDLLDERLLAIDRLVVGLVVELADEVAAEAG